jgi:hypothetical protein
VLEVVSVQMGFTPPNSTWLDLKQVELGCISTKKLNLLASPPCTSFLHLEHLEFCCISNNSNLVLSKSTLTCLHLNQFQLDCISTKKHLYKSMVDWIHILGWNPQFELYWVYPSLIGMNQANPSILTVIYMKGIEN